MAFFSVIIPLYNKEHFVKQTLQSVLKQTFNDFEVIIVNDGSTDNSLNVVNSIIDSRIKIYNQKNLGASSARNKGVELATSNWIALLDADDLWFDDHLEELHKGIQLKKNVDLISNAYEIQLTQDYIKQPVYSKSIPKQISIIENYFEYSLIDPLFWTSSLAFTKKAFQQIGGFDLELKTGQDLDLIIQFALGYKIAYNPKITLRYKRHTENNLSSYVKLSEKQKYINKYKAEETENLSLKEYLDINRYSLALQAKMQNNTELFETTKADINPIYLKPKHKLILSLPSTVLKSLKKIQLFLIKLGIYKSAFN